MTNLISANWRFAPLKRIAYVDNSGSYGLDAGQEQVDLPVATTAQISPLGEFQSSIMPIRSFSLGDCQRYKCVDGDILVVKSSGSASNIISGKAGLVRKTTPTFIFSNFLLRVRPDQRKISPSFLYRFLTSSVTRQRVELMCSTTTYPNIKVPEYISAIVPCPPLDEQIAIAEFLDRETAEADALVAKYERLIKLLEEKRVALITQAVTKGLDSSVPTEDSGVGWIGQVPKHWTIGPVSRAIIDMCDGPFGSSLKSSHYTDSGIQVIRLQNIGKGRFHNDNRAFIETGYFESLNGHDARPGDLLVAGLGDTNNFLGRSCLVPEELGPAMVKADCFRLRLDPGVLLHEFAMHYLNSGPARAEVAFASKGATRERINLGGIARLQIPIPPIPEQQAIIVAINDQLNRIELLCNKVQNAIHLTSEHRTALVTVAVTGQIDVNTYRSKKQSARS